MRSLSSLLCGMSRIVTTVCVALTLLPYCDFARIIFTLGEIFSTADCNKFAGVGPKDRLLSLKGASRGHERLRKASLFVEAAVPDIRPRNIIPQPTIVSL